MCLWNTANFGPVFCADILVDFDRLGTLAVKSILAVLFWTGNPMLSAGLNFEVIPLVTALVFLKFLPAIFDCPAGFRESNAADPRLAVQRSVLAFDINDAGL